LNIEPVILLPVLKVNKESNKENKYNKRRQSQFHSKRGYFHQVTFMFAIFGLLSFEQRPWYTTYNTVRYFPHPDRRLSLLPRRKIPMPESIFPHLFPAAGQLPVAR
jgi:hypothetical protein